MEQLPIGDGYDADTSFVANVTRSGRGGATPGQTPDSNRSLVTPASFHSAQSGNRSITTSSSAPDSVLLGHFVEDLGIEPSEDDEFAWIAEVGLQAELPPGWASRTDEESGGIYYVNHDSLASTWEHPLTPFLRQVVEIGRMYLENPTEGLFQEQKASLWQTHKADLDVWHGPIQDEEGNSYFVNSQDGISSWQDPRLARAYIYDFQCGLLNHLQTILKHEDPGEWVGGGTPWETEDGAQILTLDRSPNSTVSGTWRQVDRAKSFNRIRLGLAKKEDHTFTLQRMSTAADWLHETVQTEEEVQRNKLIQKVEARRMRKLSRKLSKTIRDSVEDRDEPQFCPRTRSKPRNSESRAYATQPQPELII